MNWHSKKEDTQDENRGNHGGERGQYSDTQGKTPDGTLSGSRLHSPVQHHDLDGTEADDPLDAPSREFHVHVGPGIGSAELESGGGQGAEKAIRILRPSHHVGAKDEEKRTGDQKDQPFPTRARRDWITHGVVARHDQTPPSPWNSVIKPAIIGTGRVRLGRLSFI
jgi:hypothetical protein